MPYDFPVQVEVDIAEPRILRDRLVVTAGGRKERQAWDIDISSNVWRDPLMRRVMLAPLCMTSAWRTTTTGNYARLTKSDYTLTTASAWVENHRGVSGNIYLEGNGTNEIVTTAASYAADQGFFISAYIPSIESLGEQTILRCGWGTPDATGSISVRFRANGGVAIYSGTTQVSYDDLDYAADNKNPMLGAVGLKTVNILLLPIRLRDTSGNSRAGELQVITDSGKSLVHGIADLAAGDSIVPAGHFWWEVPFGRPSVLLAPVKFATAGTLYGPLTTLRYAPNTPRSFVGRGFYSTIGTGASATYSLVDSTGAAYTPNGVIREVRGKVALTGDGSNSICVEAVDWTMAPDVQDTDDTEKCDITEAIKDITINLDDHGVATCTIAAHKSALETAGIKGFIHATDRPFRIYSINPDTDVETDIFRGVLSSPVWETGLGSGDDTHDLITFTGRDRSAEFGYYQFGDAVADDDKLLTDAIEDDLITAGFDSADLVASTSTVRLPMAQNPAMGEWAILPQRGSTLEEHMNGKRDKYAANWWLGWVPTLSGYKYRAYAPTDLSTTPALTIYEDDADAIAAGATAAQAAHRTVRRVTRYGIPPEGNQVIVLGMNPYTGKYLLSQNNASADQVPTTLPSARPVTWRGRTHRILEIDPSLDTPDKVDLVRATLFDRLTTERYLIDFTCDFLHVAVSGRPLWTGDVVRFYLKGGSTYEDYRLVGIPEIRLIKMCTNTQYDAGERPYYEADYRGEKIVPIEAGRFTFDSTTATFDSTLLSYDME